MKKYRLLSFILVAMFLLAFVGCQQNAESPDPSPEPTSSGESNISEQPDPSSEEPAFNGSINLMASQNWIKDIDRELFKNFQDETGVEVKIMVTPDNGYATLLGTTLADGNNAVDIFMHEAGSPMVSVGIPDLALDLSEEAWVENLEDWAKNVNTYDGKLYGFSTWGIDYEGILYNKTYFEENNLEIPKTWDEFIALCDQILELGKIPMYEPINGTWHTQSWFYALTPALLKENPELADWLNASKDNKLASLESAKEGLSQIAAFLSAKGADGQPKYYTNDGQAEDWFGSYTALQNRDTVMMFTYSAYPAELAANGCEDEWGMFPMPAAGSDAVVSNGGGISKFINKNSDNIDACLALLDFLARPENLEAYYAARTDLVTSSFKDVSSVSATTATTDAIANSNGEPPVMFMKDMLYWDTELYRYFQGFAAGTMTPEEFLENMDNYRATMFDAAETN